jgi:hypothetical protein
MDAQQKAEPKGSERQRWQAFAAIAILVGASAIIGAAAAASGCSREVVQGNLDGEAHFVARDVIVYASGMFPGNPVVVRLEGRAEQSGWYTVRLPGVKAIDQLRVVGIGPEVGGYFLEDGALHFSVEVRSDAPAGQVEIYYVAGSASWTHHYELDFARSELMLVGRVVWESKAMFRSVDMLFVSGKLHTASSWGGATTGTPAPAGAGGGSVFDMSGLVASPATDNLAAFAVPSSSDEGIFVVHRASNIDMPGANGHGLKSCQPSTFYMRVHRSPVEQSEVVVVRDTGGYSQNWSSEAGGRTPTLELELRNLGDLPWMPGRADIYRSGILAGADDLPYTARNGTVRVEMGSALDIKAEVTVETSGDRVYHNYTLQNVDVSDYAVELVVAPQGLVGELGPFARDGGLLKARVDLVRGAAVALSWWGSA